MLAIKRQAGVALKGESEGSHSSDEAINQAKASVVLNPGAHVVRGQSFQWPYKRTRNKFV